MFTFKVIIFIGINDLARAVDSHRREKSRKSLSDKDVNRKVVKTWREFARMQRPKLTGAHSRWNGFLARCLSLRQCMCRAGRRNAWLLPWQAAGACGNGVLASMLAWTCVTMKPCAARRMVTFLASHTQSLLLCAGPTIGPVNFGAA
jgi:hypothetical protein